MPQQPPAQPRKPQSPQQRSSKDRSGKQTAIIGAVAIIIAAIISAAAVILVAYIQEGGKEPTPTPFFGETPHPISTPTPILPAFVNGSFSTSSNSTNMVSLSVNPGDLLIVAVTEYERTLVGPNPITDDQGDQYHDVGNVIANPDQQQDYAELYYAQNAKGGLTTVTVSFAPPPDTDGGDTSLGLYEYRGLGSLDTVLPTTSKNASGKILTESSKLNTTAASEMCFALVLQW